MFEWIDLAGAGPALAYLIEVTGKSVVVLTLAAVVVVLFRRSSAADRHRIWFAALCGIILFPVLAALMPSWRVIQNPEWLDMLRSADFDLTPPNMQTDIPPIPEDARVYAVSTIGESPLDFQAAEAMAATQSDTFVPLEEPSQTASTSRAATKATGEITVPSSNPVFSSLAALFNSVRQMHWTTALFWLWILGAVLVLSQLVIGAVGVLVLSRRSIPLHGSAWNDLADEIGDRLFLKRDVLLLRSRDTSMPMTWGGVNPVVLLPADADSWTDERKRCVLTHEFAHIKRWDCATQGVAQLACAIYWFNPFVWMAARRLRIEREKACDDYVISVGTQASNYAGHLLEIARSLKSSLFPPLGAVSMARPSQLEGRVLAILDPSPRQHRFTTAAKVVVTLLAIGVVIPLSAMAPSSSGELESELATTLSRISNAPAAVAAEVGAPSPSSLESTMRADVYDAIAPAGADTTDDEKRRLRLIKAFSKALTDEDVEIRENAAHVLGNLGGEEAISPLQQVLLSDSEVSVREQAAWALGEIGSDTAVASLVRALEDENAGVRRHVIWALGEIESADAAPALIRQLEREEDGQARESIVWALGNLGDEDAIGALDRVFRTDERVSIRRKAIWALAEIESSKSFETFLLAADDNDEEVRNSALWALSELEDSRAVPVFQKALTDESADVRRRAVYGLAQLDDTASIDALMLAAKDSDNEVRRIAIWAIGELENDRALGVLIEAVDDANEEVRRAAVYALGELQNDSTVGALVRALDSSDAEIRRSAAWSLGEIQSSEAATALINAADDSDPEVKRTVIWALAEIEDERAIPALIRATRDSDEELRKTAAYALGEFESREVESTMIRLMSDESEEVRSTAARILSDYESSEAEDALIRALQSDTSPEVRRAAAYGLGQIESDRCIEALEKALDDTSAEVRKAVMRALGSMDLSDASGYSSDRISVRLSDDLVQVSDAVASIGETVSLAAVSAVTSVSTELLSSHLSTAIYDATEEAVTSVDWSGVATTIRASLNDLDNEIEASVVESLIEVARDRANTREGRDAIRSLRRSNHPDARRFIRNLDR